MSGELIASLGEPPRTHGLLGAMLEPDAAPERAIDIRRDPRFRGWWPRAHPSMSSFSACRSSRAGMSPARST
jgi:hypothetical protein